MSVVSGVTFSKEMKASVLQDLLKEKMKLWVTNQPSLGFDKRSVDAVHLMVQPAGVTQVVTGTVSPPEGG